MKKTKKLASLFLALVMALSVMAVTAAACGEDGHVHDEVCCEETIVRRPPAAPECGYCGLPMALISGTYNNPVYKCMNPDCSSNKGA